MKRILIKIGTKILTTPENKLDLNNLRKLTNEISKLKITHKYQCIIVSSGSIISGSEELSIFPKTIPEKQASASVGQILLMREYGQFFAQNNKRINMNGVLQGAGEFRVGAASTVNFGSTSNNSSFTGGFKMLGNNSNLNVNTAADGTFLKSGVSIAPDDVSTGHTITVNTANVF